MMLAAPTDRYKENAMAFFRKFFVMGFCLFLLIPTSARAGEERESCHLCGMWIDQYQRTACELVHNDGKTEHTCGVACMLRIVQENGVSAFRSIRVKDWNNGTGVDSRDAWYSIGSRLIPDMIPNYIAFADRIEAEVFAAEKGGAVLSFVSAMETISPRGMTQPFRIRQAVTPGQGSFGLGIVYAYMIKDKVAIGSDSQDPESFINNNPAQPRAPKKMETQIQTLVMNYGITDRLAMQVNLPYFEKSMETLVRQGKQVVTASANDDGIGDLCRRSAVQSMAQCLPRQVFHAACRRLASHRGFRRDARIQRLSQGESDFNLSGHADGSRHAHLARRAVVFPEMGIFLASCPSAVSGFTR